MVKFATCGEPPQTGVAQLRQIAQRVASIAGTHMGEGLGESVDLAGREGECSAHITNGVAHAVGLHHRHGGDPLNTKTLNDRVVDLQASRGLDVDVDIGQLTA